MSIFLFLDQLTSSSPFSHFTKIPTSTIDTTSSRKWKLNCMNMIEIVNLHSTMLFVPWHKAQLCGHGSSGCNKLFNLQWHRKLRTFGIFSKWNVHSCVLKWLLRKGGNWWDLWWLILMWYLQFWSFYCKNFGRAFWGAFRKLFF